jgi:extracellular factor (EF) 3-hydroxypalmitic acid methyl ester biosynthesis protein
MQPLIDSFFDHHVAPLTRTLEQFAQQVPPADEPTSDELVDQLTQQIHTILAACGRLERQLGDAKLVRAVQARFREAIWPWFGQSWFMERALTKPRGYPGDHEMLTAIYNGQVHSRGLGGYLDGYFLNTTLAQAVRGRMRALRRFLLAELNGREGDVNVLNVACGPCREYTDNFAPTNHRQIRLTCVDNDTQALDFVATNVAPQIAHGITATCVRYNALRMTSVRHNVERFGRPDIIYSVGLCDYIPDEYLVPMLRGWRESLSEGGVVYVAFKDGLKYDKAEYQWLVDWFFYQRTEDDCRALFEAAGYDLHLLELTRDATGVIINFIGRTNVAGVRRTDAAEALPKPPQVAISGEAPFASGGVVESDAVLG